MEIALETVFVNVMMDGQELVVKLQFVEYRAEMELFVLTCQIHVIVAMLVLREVFAKHRLWHPVI